MCTAFYCILPLANLSSTALQVPSFSTLMDFVETTDGESLKNSMIPDGVRGSLGFSGRAQPSRSSSCELSRVGAVCMSDISSGCPAPKFVKEVALEGVSAAAEIGEAVDCTVVGESGEAANRGEVTSGWTKRVRVGKTDVEREWCPTRKSALELSVRDFTKTREGLVVNPAVGMSFDTLAEAYSFYNLYSWETGFGIDTN